MSAPLSGTPRGAGVGIHSPKMATKALEHHDVARLELLISEDPALVNRRVDEKARSSLLVCECRFLRAHSLKSAFSTQAESSGNTLLHVACWFTCAEAVLLLLKHGADVSAANTVLADISF